MRYSYAVKQIEMFHEKYGNGTPAQVQNGKTELGRQCSKFMDVWNHKKGYYKWEEINLWYHVGDRLLDPADNLLYGWEDWDLEVIQTGKSWFEIYVKHIEKWKWEAALEALNKRTNIDKEDLAMMLLTTIRDQMGKDQNPDKKKVVRRRCNDLLEELGYEWIALSNVPEYRDKLGVDYVDEDEKVVVQSKQSYERWLR